VKSSSASFLALQLTSSGFPESVDIAAVMANNHPSLFEKAEDGSNITGE
jgi:hypothetical protein